VKEETENKHLKTENKKRRERKKNIGEKFFKTSVAK
jgi:hypothetical protein